MCEVRFEGKNESMATWHQRAVALPKGHGPRIRKVLISLDNAFGMRYAYLCGYKANVRGWSPTLTRRVPVENHELRATYQDGTARTYSYASLPEALTHACQVAALDDIAEVSVWTVSEKRVFAYIPAQPSRTLQRQGA
jgi:hypothetical protein